MVAPIHASRDAHASRHLTLSEVARLRGRLDDELVERRAGASSVDTDEVDRELAEHVAAGNVQAIADIEHAFARLEDGTYGTCEGCGSPIPFARLEAMPAARRCVGCPPQSPVGLFG
jgi:RNA polymerase-binding transcription factor DksA